LLDEYDELGGQNHAPGLGAGGRPRRRAISLGGERKTPLNTPAEDRDDVLGWLTKAKNGLLITNKVNRDFFTE